MPVPFQLSSFAVALFVAGPLLAQCELARISGPDGGTHPLALDDERLLVGAPFDTFVSPGGSAAVHVRDGLLLRLESTLVPTDVQGGDLYGIAVALDSDTLAVGASGAGAAAGAVYTHEFDGSAWVETQKLVPSDAAAGGRFGHAVALVGDVLVVGAWGDSTQGANAGAAYVWRRVGGTWTEETKLFAPSASAGARFGRAIAFDGVTLAVAAPRETPAGAVSFFEASPSGWDSVGSIVSPSPAGFGEFGTSVAVRDSTAVIGDPETGSGEVHVFERAPTGWATAVGTLLPAPGPVMTFGASVSLSDTGRLVVGAPDFDQILGSGKAFSFRSEAGTWGLEDEITVLDSMDVAAGAATAARGDLVAITARFDRGSVYVYAASGGTDCDQSGTPDLCDLIADAASDCDRNAVLDVRDVAAGVDCNGNGVPDPCDTTAEVVLLDESFESGIPIDWGATGIAHVTQACPPPTACDGTRWVYFGVDASCNFDTPFDPEGTLQLPSLTVPGDARTALLTFCSAYEGECGSVTGGYDLAWILVDGVVVDDVSRSCDSLDWQTRTIDLYPWRGRTIAIEFIFDAVDMVENQGLGWQVDGVRLVATVPDPSLDANGNQVPNVCELPFLRGDCDASGSLSVADALAGLDVLFGQAPYPACPDACDANDDGRVNIGDTIWTLSAIFGGGPVPPAPYPDCGGDPTVDPLLCAGAPPPCP